MIIFDLDGTLADCNHRRHYVDPDKNTDYIKYSEPRVFKDLTCGYVDKWLHKDTGKKFKPNWKAFNEACVNDLPIPQTIRLLNHFILIDEEVQIWSGRCESVRTQTEEWLRMYLYENDQYPIKLKMRPVSDNTPDDQLKEQWLDEALYKQGHNIECVFDDRPKVVRMWKRRGIFVFNCCQDEKEF